MALSINSKLGELLDNPQAKAILDKHMEGFSTHPQLALARHFSLKMAASMSGGRISKDVLAVVNSELATL